MLDLKQDKYFGISTEDMRALERVVVGWPPANQPTETADLPSIERAIAVAEELLACHLLTIERGSGKSAVPVAIPAPNMMLSGTIRTERPRIRFSDVLCFLSACLHASWLLRTRTLETIAKRMAARKQRALRRGIRFEVESARRAVAIFDRLRPYLFTEMDRCLFNSLALLNFLALHDLYPMWVIGIRTVPFEAHSWIQHENWAMDDRAETVRYYIPVLAI